MQKCADELKINALLLLDMFLLVHTDAVTVCIWWYCFINETIMLVCPFTSMGTL